MQDISFLKKRKSIDDLDDEQENKRIRLTSNVLYNSNRMNVEDDNDQSEELLESLAFHLREDTLYYDEFSFNDGMRTEDNDRSKEFLESPFNFNYSREVTRNENASMFRNHFECPDHLISTGSWEIVSDEIRIVLLFQRNPMQPLDMDFLLNVMTQVFPNEAAIWTEQIRCPVSRPTFLQQMWNYVIPDRKLHQVKEVLFCLLCCVDNFASSVSTIEPIMSFYDAFGYSIGRLLQNQPESLERNPNLLLGLAYSYQYLTYLFSSTPLKCNLGFLLLFVSCVEGSGMYYGRISDVKTMCIPYKCYRYMIETMSGGRLLDIPSELRLSSENHLIEIFESQITRFSNVEDLFNFAQGAA